VQSGWPRSQTSHSGSPVTADHTPPDSHCRPTRAAASEITAALESAGARRADNGPLLGIRALLGESLLGLVFATQSTVAT